MTSRTAQLAEAVSYLRKCDRALRRVIDRVGPCRLKLKKDRFEMLSRSIVSQQVSGKAARAIFARLEQRLDRRITPEQMARLNAEELRSLGLSRQKAAYLHDLAAKTQDGTVRLSRLGRLDDSAIIEEVTQVKGIGEWTAHMLLIFSVGRLDVLPVDDFGIRSAVRQLYGLSDLPKRQETEVIARPWRPYASIASWYLWRSLDNDG